MIAGVLSNNEMLGLLSVAIAAVAYSRYFWNIYKKRTKPHAFTWALWTLITAIAFFAQRTQDTGPGTWALGSDTVMNFVCAILAIRWGEKNITKSDWAAFLGALAAIPVWVLASNPLGAVFLVTLIDALSFYPTIRKSYLKPREETGFMFGMSALRFIISVLALESFTFVTAFYPLFIAVANISLVTMLLWRRAALAKRAAENGKTREAAP